MRYVRLGKSGLKVSVVSFGAWQIGSPLWGAVTSMDMFRKLLVEALSRGVNLFDTAEVYGAGVSERVIGEVFGNSDDVVVISKIGGFRTTLDSILKGAEAIRRRLRRDSIDVLLYHWPPPYYTPICRVIRSLEEVVNLGIASYIGVSNFSTKDLRNAMECLKKCDIVVNQVQYSLAYRTPENKLKPFMEEHGIALMAWSPLAKGALAGKVKADNTARKIDKVFKVASEDESLQSTLRKIAKDRNATLAQVAIAWLIAKNALPVVGVRKEKHLEELVKASELNLTVDEVKLLDSASEKYRKMWGVEYKHLRTFRALPGPIQQLVIKLMGGF